MRAVNQKLIILLEWPYTATRPFGFCQYKEEGYLLP